MSRGLLDTSVVIAQADEGLDASLPDEVAISVATLAELHYGVLAAKDEETRRHRLLRLGTIEAMFEPLAIDPQVGRAFATVAWTVKTAAGQPRARVMDLWIAATALAYQVPLYTRNAEDFRLLNEILEVRTL
jgi:hypothetical protein